MNIDKQSVNNNSSINSLINNVEHINETLEKEIIQNLHETLSTTINTSIFFELCKNISSFFDEFIKFEEKIQNFKSSHDSRFINTLMTIRTYVSNWRKFINGTNQFKQYQINEMKDVFTEWMKKFHNTSEKLDISINVCNIIDSDIHKLIVNWNSNKETQHDFNENVEILIHQRENLLNKSKILRQQIIEVISNNKTQWESTIAPLTTSMKLKLAFETYNDLVFQFWFVCYYLINDYKTNMMLRKDFDSFSKNLINTARCHFIYDSPLYDWMFDKCDITSIISAATILKSSI